MTSDPQQPQKEYITCVTCGISKDPSEFPPVVKKDIFFTNECISCRRIKSKTRYRKSIRENDILDEAARRKVSKHNKKVRACAKMFCQTIESERIVKLQCPVCKIFFGVTKTVYNSTFNHFGRPPKYCSKRCYYISLTKKWQQKQSPYAQKISELLKVQP